jgi:response regulator of citrate/malate metabolism
MSANEHTDTVFECIRGGAEDYLLKPVTKKEVQYIWQHVWRRQQQNAMRVPNIQEEVRHNLSFQRIFHKSCRVAFDPWWYACIFADPRHDCF